MNLDSDINFVTIQIFMSGTHTKPYDGRTKLNQN